MSFPLFTTIPPTSDFRPFIENWEQSGFRVTSINNPDEAKALRAAGVNLLEVESQAKKLKISEIMRAIAATGEPLAGFINADCRFVQPINAEAIKPIAKNSLILAERIDVNDSGAATAFLCMGFDGFFFDTAYLKTIAEAEYRIGTPWWDYWFPLAMRQAGASLRKFSCPILLHTAHELNWDRDTYLEGASELQAAFPTIRVVVDDRPDEFSCFYELSRNTPVFPPGLDEITANLLSSIPSLIKDIRAHQDSERQLRAILAARETEESNMRLRNSDLEQHAARQLEYVGFLQNENALLQQANIALLNSTPYRISYPLRLASTIAKRLFRLML